MYFKEKKESYEKPLKSFACALAFNIRNLC